MTAEQLTQYRDLANAHTQHRSAKIILELCDEVEKLSRRKERKRRQGHLFAPTIIELCAYGKEIGLSADECTHFFDHHEARGWKYKSGLPMADWKAALRTWKTNQARFNGSVQHSSGQCTPERLLSVSEAQRLRREKHNENMV